MTSHRTISSTLTLLAVLMTVASSTASANSLLSGYGGPGEGNQVILGSALLGGKGGGGSSGGSSGSTLSSSSSTPSVDTKAGGSATPTNSKRRGSTARGKDKRTAGRASGSQSRGEEASGSAARAYPVSAPGNTSTGASETLGLSGEDLGYVLLALVVLAFTGLATRRLARTTRPEGP
jgi:hypothetical protein